MTNSHFELFSSKRFLPLFITQFLGAFNDNVFKTALVILITFKVTSLAGLSSQQLVTLTAALFILPFFIFSAIAGQLADKFEKSRLISIVKAFEVVLMIIASLGFYNQNIYLLLFVLLLLGIQAAFFGPLKYAILPNQLHDDELIAGNGFIEAATFIAILLGMMLGGFVILLHFGEYFISIIGCLLAIAGFYSSLYIPNTHQTNSQLKINPNIFQETLTLIAYSQHQRDIRLAILGLSWFWLVGLVYLTEVSVFTKDILHGNENVVTMLLAVFSIGIGAGSILCNKLLKGKVDASYVPLSALGITLFTIDLFFTANQASLIPATTLMNPWQFFSHLTYLHVALDLLLVSICGGLYSVPLYAILQQRSNPAHRARVIASNNVINALFMVVGIILTMLMLKLGLLVHQVFLVMAIANGIVAIYICKLLPAALVKSTLRAIFQLLYRVKVTGLENYWAAGEKVLIVANHTSFLDAALLAVYLPDRLFFAVDTEVAQKWWVKLFLTLVDAFPMDPTNPMAIKSLIELMKTNKKCVIFPEGRLTMTGALMKIYEGPGLIADKSGAKLLPICIQGAQLTPFSRLRGKVRIRFAPRIKLIISKVQEINVDKNIKGRKRRQKISLVLYDIMTKMIFDSCDYHRTLFSSLLDAKSAHGRNKVILRDIKRVALTYQQLIVRSFLLGDQIAKITQRGDYVGILLPNLTSTVITFFGLHAYYRTPVMLNYTSGTTNLLSACQTATIKTIFSSRQFIELTKLTELVSHLQAAGIQIVYLEDLKIQLFDKMKALLKALFPRIFYHQQLPTRSKNILSSSPAVVLFTSGSEGTPKGVVLSHQNIQANRYQLSACIDFVSTDQVLNALPLFHSFGLSGGLFLPLLSGVQIFLYPSPLHYRVIPQIAYDINATIFFATDTFLSGYAKYAHVYDFYSVRYVFSGAEKLRAETMQTWSQKFGVRIFDGYGATETSPVLATNTPMQNQVGTVGRLLPDISYQLLPVPGISDGGQLLVAGPNIMKGYLLAEQPGIIIPPKNGWYDTGDIVKIDEFKYVTILGRAKRFAKIAGEMVSLSMVEQYIQKLWPPFQHAVISKPDTKKGEQLILVTTYEKATREEITAFFKTNLLPDLASPKQIIIVKALPLLGTGKIDYPAIKKQYSSNE